MFLLLQLPQEMVHVLIVIRGVYKAHKGVEADGEARVLDELCLAEKSWYCRHHQVQAPGLELVDSGD